MQTWKKGDYVQYRKLEEIPKEERKREHGNRKFTPSLRKTDEYLGDKPLLPETTAKTLREEFANRLSHLQESCKHESTKWMNIEWAPGHVSGRGRVCLRCEKILETKNEFEPNNPKLRNLLKKSKRLR
jgi:hypothetical protein